MINASRLMNITEEPESQFQTTPGKDSDHEIRSNASEIQIEESGSHTHPNVLNQLVTKVDPFMKLPKQSKLQNDDSSEVLFHEQGQTSGEEDSKMGNSPQTITCEKTEEYERIVDKFTEKDESSSHISMSKSETSELISDPNDTSGNNGIQEEEEQQSDLHKAHLIQTLQAIQYIKSLPNNHRLDGKFVSFPPHPSFDSDANTKTIIFDLDETLVH